MVVAQLFTYLTLVVLISIVASTLTRFRMPPPSFPRTGWPNNTGWPRAGERRTGVPGQSPSVPAGPAGLPDFMGAQGPDDFEGRQSAKDEEGRQSAADAEGKSMLDTGPALAQADETPVESPAERGPMFLTHDDVARAVIAAEVLGKPRALRPWRSSGR